MLTLPGCPANPYNLLGTVLQFVALGTLPELDDIARHDIEQMLADLKAVFP